MLFILHRSKRPKLCPELYRKECYTQDKFEALLLQAKSSLQLSECQESSSRKSENYPNIIFFGTGSSRPTTTRNNTSILLTLRLVGLPDSLHAVGLLLTLQVICISLDIRQKWYQNPINLHFLSLFSNRIPGICNSNRYMDT